MGSPARGWGQIGLRSEGRTGLTGQIVCPIDCCVRFGCRSEASQHNRYDGQSGGETSRWTAVCTDFAREKTENVATPCIESGNLPCGVSFCTSGSCNECGETRWCPKGRRAEQAALARNAKPFPETSYEELRVYCRLVQTFFRMCYSICVTGVPNGSADGREKQSGSKNAALGGLSRHPLITQRCPTGRKS